MSNEEDKNGEECRSAEVRRTVTDVRPRNWSVPVILLSLREHNSYGYELMKRTAVYGFGEMNPGTLYRSLRQMEKEGLCEGTWETSSGGGPARRVYSLTDAGEAYLEFWAKSLEKYRQKMDAFFRLYSGGQARTDHGEEVA
jgi:PadR family transcriptional regulator, regulatory protein PadR